MSWELSSVVREHCPCGQGFIEQELYSDDWNRYQSGEVYISCSACKQKYKVEREFHVPSKPWVHSGETYYLTPIDYPEYEGITEEEVYGKQVCSSRGSFTNYLIENFSKQDLICAYNEFLNVTNSAKVVGVAKKIRDCHKWVFNSVKLVNIRQRVFNAINLYDNYVGSFDQRKVVREQEKHARQAYIQEKRKVQIRLHF